MWIRGSKPLSNKKLLRILFIGGRSKFERRFNGAGSRMGCYSRRVSCYSLYVGFLGLYVDFYSIQAGCYRRSVGFYSLSVG